MREKITMQRNPVGGDVPSAFEIILDRGTAGIEYRFSAGVKGTQDASAIRDSRSVG